MATDEAMHRDGLKPTEEWQDYGWGRAMRSGSTFACRFILKDGWFIAPYINLVVSPDPRCSDDCIRLRYSSDSKDTGMHEVTIKGRKLTEIGDHLAASRVYWLRAGGERDGTLIESITALPVTED